MTTTMTSEANHHSPEYKQWLADRRYDIVRSSRKGMKPVETVEVKDLPLDESRREAERLQTFHDAENPTLTSWTKDLFNIKMTTPQWRPIR